MKTIKFNKEKRTAQIETDHGYKTLIRLNKNVEYTDYSSWYTINDKIYI